MKRSFKVLGIIVLIFAFGVVGAISYIKVALPDVGEAPQLQVEVTPERVEHGRYLAYSVAACMDCHSTRDWSRFSGPIIPGTLGKGGERFDQTMGFPGVFYSKNITPFGVQRYTDGELYRLITSGVTKEGRAIFPVMPFPYYGQMDNEDVYAIIAFLRTLSPIESAVADSEADFPMNILLNTIPRKNTPSVRPPKSDTVAYGAYLTNAAACKECHTQAERGQIIPELAFSGGREFIFPDGAVVRSANLTPDQETGLGQWTKHNFIQRFRLHADSSYVPPPVKSGDFNTIMPWTLYGTMTEEDLGAIYAYLHSLEPIRNQVVKYSPAAGKELTAAGQ